MLQNHTQMYVCVLRVDCGASSSTMAQCMNGWRILRLQLSDVRRNVTMNKTNKHLDSREKNVQLFDTNMPTSTIIIMPAHIGDYLFLSFYFIIYIDGERKTISLKILQCDFSTFFDFDFFAAKTFIHSCIIIDSGLFSLYCFLGHCRAKSTLCCSMVTASLSTRMSLSYFYFMLSGADAVKNETTE